MEKAIAWCKLANVLEEKIVEANDQCKKQAKAGRETRKKHTFMTAPRSLYIVFSTGTCLSCPRGSFNGYGIHRT